MLGDSSTSIHILHVDDDPDFVELAAEVIEQHDERFDVETATSASDGIDRLAHDGYDCVISDYDMPETDGIEFLDTVRENYPNLPFILFTGKGSEEVASDAIAAGVTDYLQKKGGSEQYELLSNRIQHAVEQTRSKQQATAHQRINNMVAKINEALVLATIKREIDTSVCEIITDAEPYRFAWIGEHNPESSTIEPRSSAGIEDEYLQEVPITSDSSQTGAGPTGRAARNHEIAVVQSIPDDPQYAPWREAALERGYRSSAAIPLTFEDTLFGILNVYADRTHAFDDRERQLLSNLGQTIAHAYHRIELQRQYAEQYRILFEDAPVMLVFTRDFDGEPIIEECNQMFAERLGYTHEEVIETPLADYYSESSVETLFEHDGYERALTGDFVREQRTLIATEGEEVLTILRASPRRNHDGYVIGTLALYLDISDEQQVTELRRQNKRLEEFAGVVSHDLRNPLNVASGRLELAMEECVSEHFIPVAQALDRMEILIEDVLGLALAGETLGELESIQLAELVEACWRIVEVESAQMCTETDATIRGNKPRLQQLFENLFRNSVEHGGDRVTITVGDLPGGFYVEDDGAGIPAEDRTQVMQPGFSTSVDGTGFGLSIVRDVAEAHSWEITVTSSKEGGARFEITGVEFSAE